MNENEEIYSFNKINYVLRPRKQIERKILFYLLNKIELKMPLEKYSYIGMGSIHYYDFVLIHKFLNIEKLVSIDDKNVESRFNFNKPYEFIDFYNTKTTTFLEDEMKWDNKNRNLIWFDYDQKLENYMLKDICNIAKNCNPQDILIFTINANCPPIGPKRDLFWKKFGKYTSVKYSDKKFITPKYYISLLHDIFSNFINKCLKDEPLNFYQIFSFKYRDGAQMYTMGGIFDTSNDCIKNIEKLNFVSTDDTLVEINPPILTYHEKLHLDSKINTCRRIINDYDKKKGTTDPEKLKIEIKEKMIKEFKFELNSINELKSYVEYYKYFPQYYEGII